MPGPHDLFARYTFGRPERAEAELRAVLPAHVVSEVDWSSLRLEPSSVVDPELRETESDLLFSARLRTGRSLLLYVLLEHQSTVDRWMALRMLRYVVRQVERWRQEHPERSLLPVIIPLVMYHGPEGAWTAPRRVEDLFELPGEIEEERKRWRALVPSFEYLLDDLTAEREEALKARPGPPLARLAWLVLRYGRTEELARKLPEWVSLFAQVHAAPEGAEHLVVVIRYLLWTGDKAVHDAAGQVLHSVLDEQRAEELMRSYGEELIEQGRQQGLEKGLARGREEGLARGLSRGRAEDILRILTRRGVHVDEGARQRILDCTDMDTLDSWFDRALQATTLSEVLDGGAHASRRKDS
ncbi:Rpn family recombination-promoting nuclease/putative transposase [Archangium minus]|uniref:Rpn family recombination-promoting nuclease/putative transposase n=1 Tax=Archangium minus TaxID=83450 RepID=A0ABY9WK59_9BACT|nr:Rpn family recombination-promoting nuclease/putative transposase [Archangium violaceum]WNG44144.1 Rpn family recombination-promoting nuclease/putative transposase [Archangium minus]